MPGPLAAKYSLDLPRAISVEFPANVKNDDKALSMIGGASAISHAADKQESLQLRLRPADKFEHPISSRITKHQNILLKVKIAKKWLVQANNDIRLAIRLSNGKYTVNPERILETNFKFREISDFQWNTSDSQFLRKVQPSILSGNLQAIKNLNLNLPQSNTPLDAIPPPRFSQIVTPFNYGYKQNPALSLVSDEAGNSRLVNNSGSQKLHSVMLGWDDPSPKTSPAGLNKSPELPIAACINELTQLFEKRPIWTRKGIEANLDRDHLNSVKFALPYVAYSFKSGPYRGAYVKYGLDPRESSEYAKYQTEHFRISNKRDESKSFNQEDTTLDADDISFSSNSNAHSYIFDGIHLLTSRIVELCDVTDPSIAKLIENSRINETFDRQHDGWYVSEDIEEIRRSLRTGLMAIKEGKSPNSPAVQDIANEKRTKTRPTPAKAKAALLKKVSNQNNSILTQLDSKIDRMDEDGNETDDHVDR